MPCWAAHTLYQLMTFKVMHNPTPFSSRFPLHLSSHAQSTYLLQFFLLSPFPDLRDRSLKCHVSSWLWRRFVGHLLFLSFRHCELHTPCKQRFLSGMAFNICKVIPGGTILGILGGGSPNPDQVFQTKKCHSHTHLRPHVGRKCVMFT